MQSIMLGTQELGQVEIQAYSVAWQETPVYNAKTEKAATHASIFIECDYDNLKELDMFYQSVTLGDISEGIQTNKPYYKLLGVKYKTDMFHEKLSWDELDSYGWSMYQNVPDNWFNVRFIVEVY